MDTQEINIICQNQAVWNWYRVVNVLVQRMDERPSAVALIIITLKLDYLRIRLGITTPRTSKSNL